MDHEEAKKVAEAFCRALETNELGDLFDDDVFCDINIPEWRFQVQGTAALRNWLPSAQPNGSRVASWECEPTASGVLIEVEQMYDDVLSRNIHRIAVRNGKVTAWTLYCTGEWSAELQERQRREAPMIRP